MYNSTLSDPQLRLQIGLECARISGQGTASSFRSLGIPQEDQETIKAIALACATTCGGYIGPYFKNFGISPEDQKGIKEIVMACAIADGAQTAKHFKEFGIFNEDQEAIKTIALACCTRSSVEPVQVPYHFQNFGISPQFQDTIKQMALICAKVNGVGTAKAFRNFGIDPADQEGIKEIALACASFGGAAEFFRNFGLDPTDQENTKELVRACAANPKNDTAKYFKNFGINPLDQEFIREIALVCATNSARETASYLDRFGLSLDNPAVIPEVVQQCAFSEFTGFDKLSASLCRNGYPFDHKTLKELALERLNKSEGEDLESYLSRVTPVVTRNAYAIYQHYEDIRAETKQRVPALTMLHKISGIQKAAANIAHDPWRLELVPLLHTLVSEERPCLDFRKTADCQEFYELVKRFGISNSPELVKLHTRLNRGELPEEVVALLGTKILTAKSPKERLNRLKSYVDNFSSSLVSQDRKSLERLAASMQSPLAKELFRAALGKSSFGGTDDPASLIDRLLDSMNREPEKFELQPHERERDFFVSKVARTRDAESSQGIRAQITTILSDPSYEKIRTLVVRSFNEGQEELVQHLHGYHYSLGTKLGELEDGTDPAMELFVPLLFRDAMARQPLGMEDKVALIRKGEGKDVASCIAMYQWLSGYFNEHYLGQGRPAYLTKSAVNTGRELLGIDENGGVLGRIVDAVEREVEKGLVRLEEREPFNLVPTKSNGRTFSGDVGDACTTSQAVAFASGSHPDITAYLYVTSIKGLAIRGSLLTISTHTPDGRKVLHIRANNPRENLKSQYDTEELLNGAIGALIKIASEGGYDFVTVPLDARSASCSNRDYVHSYYHRKFAGCEKVGLINSPETNFNGYPNWDPAGPHPSVIIWSKKPGDGSAG